MRNEKRYLLFILVWVCNIFYGQKIGQYQLFFGTLKDSSGEWVTFRKFYVKSTLKYLVVNPQNFTTKLISGKKAVVSPLTFEALKTKLGTTPYLKALADAVQNAMSLQDAGIVHALVPEKGVVLTIDLCPSSKNLDRDIFTTLMTAFKNVEIPVPLALSVSGLWLNAHQNDLKWIKSLVSNKEIKVDWINHTYSHPYNKLLPLQRNFVLENGVNLKDEILKNEITMLENGLIPSVFFRFPGLVSSDSVFKEVVSYGIIPVGSDAWLAKGQKPTVGGSFVLIHGNGNEPVGVEDFIELIRKESADIKSKSWILQNLNESME